MSSDPAYIESLVPEAFRSTAWGLAAWQWLALLVSLILAFGIGHTLAFIGVRFGTKLARRTEADWDGQLLETLRRPTKFFLAVLVFNVLRDFLELPSQTDEVVGRLLRIVMVGALAWAIVGAVGVVGGAVERRAMASGEGPADVDVRARAIKTRVRVLRRVVNVAVVIVALALMLLQFETVRNIGVSLLASAGVAGVVLGLAAQRTIGGLIAGIQLSLTQPIRIGDVVIVEKEWGRIEEITLTFVVVRIWDERRLIVPMTRFFEQPFENWTKVSPQLHGTIFFHVDWTLPIDALRSELDRIVENHPRWDGRTKSVCVTDTSEQTIQVRALVSAANSGDLWDLRVHVRERIVAWLQQYEGGRYLPRHRLSHGEVGAAPSPVDSLR